MTFTNSPRRVFLPNVHVRTLGGDSHAGCEGGFFLDDSSLKTNRRRESTAVVVEVDGDLDIDNAAQLRGEIGRALSSGGDVPLVLDLRKVTFLDSSGLAALLWARSARRESQFEMRVVVAAGSQPERIFKLAGFESMMTAE